MDYQVILSPELSITPEAFIAAWNADPSCRDTALAARLDAPPAGYPVDPGTVLVFLGGVATTLATGVITNLISDLLKQKFFHTKQPPSSMDIVVIEHAPGTRLLVVKPPD
jgi:hypothetical protein